MKAIILSAGQGSRLGALVQLLVEAIDEGRLTLRADSRLAGRRILFHGHCHQKAEVGTAASMALLRRIPGAHVVEIDSGCCGMAGSFGFDGSTSGCFRNRSNNKLRRG